MPKAKKNATVAQRVEMPRKMFAQYKGDYVVTEGVDTRNITVASADGWSVPVRVYRRSGSGQDLPMLVYYHGGGFFGGGVDIVEQMCKVLVSQLDCVVLNVDYRLCPEAHYPQPLDDCWAATRWAFEHAAELGAALGAAGSVLQTGGLEARDVVLALMVGNILSTPMRAIRHQLPAYAGFYRPALALRLILANQGLRAASMAVVTLLYWWIVF